MPIASPEKVRKAKEFLVKYDLPILDELVHVPEYAIITKDFSKDKTPVYVGVSTCVLLEICNRCDDRKRTFFSMTHIPKYMAYDDGSIIPKIIIQSIKEFKSIGGTLEDCEIRVYGGCSATWFYKSLRSNLEKCSKMLRDLGMIKKDFEFPKLYVNPGENQTSELFFLEDKVIFIRDQLPDERGRMIGSESYLKEVSKIFKVKDGQSTLRKVDEFFKYHGPQIDRAISATESLGGVAKDREVIHAVNKVLKESPPDDKQLIEKINAVLPQEFTNVPLTRSSASLDPSSSIKPEESGSRKFTSLEGEIPGGRL